MTSFVLFEELPGIQGDIGLITLNRPQALNALNYEMFLALHEYLKRWETQENIKAIVIKAVPGRAFSAGGDIRSVYELKKTHQLSELMQFFPYEYKVNQQIFHYPKPYIALLDGITMGGGAGISIHGSHRIGTSNLVFAMPETAIGFYPDIGASYFLSRLVDSVGMYLGLTGEKIPYQDCYALGLIDIVIDSEKQNQLIDILVKNPLPNDLAVTLLINQFAVSVPASPLLEYKNEINTAFSKDSVEDILMALKNMNSEWSLKWLNNLNLKSPTSLKVTFEELKRGKNVEFDECMAMEMRISHHMVECPDFFEGIRALLIDKDQKPKWQPKELSAVESSYVEHFFNPIE